MSTDPDHNVIIEPEVGNQSLPDAIALRYLQTYMTGELARIQKRSDKWIAGLVAITGVLTTAVVIKGPESFTKLEKTRSILGISIETQDAIIGLMLVGGILIGLGIYWAYGAAYGDPLADDALATRARDQKVAGAWKAWTDATNTAARGARSTLARAMVATIVGTLLLAAAVVLTWTTPEKSSPSEVVCFSTTEGTVKIEGPVPTVSEGKLTLVPCSG